MYKPLQTASLRFMVQAGKKSMQSKPLYVCQVMGQIQSLTVDIQSVIGRIQKGFVVVTQSVFRETLHQGRVQPREYCVKRIFICFQICNGCKIYVRVAVVEGGGGEVDVHILSAYFLLITFRIFF